MPPPKKRKAKKILKDSAQKKVKTEQKTSIVLLDIEGTTTPIDFVAKELFPYARQHLPAFIKSNMNDEKVKADVEALREEMNRLENKNAGDTTEDSLIQYIGKLMDENKKQTNLKSLQGMVWETGYKNSELRGQLFEDVKSCLEQWVQKEKRKVYIYSSGSVQAQKLLFAHSVEGDITPLLSGYFDTNIGQKMEKISYENILKEIGA